MTADNTSTSTAALSYRVTPDGLNTWICTVEQPDVPPAEFIVGARSEADALRIAGEYLRGVVRHELRARGIKGRVKDVPPPLALTPTESRGGPAAGSR